MTKEEKKAEYKERHRIAQQKYREKNKEILKAKDKIYRDNNKDKIKARNEVWRKRKKAEQKAKDKLIEELKRKVDSQLSILTTTRRILLKKIEENKKLKEAMKELNNYNKFRIQENEKLKEKNDRLIQNAKEPQERIDEWGEILDRQNDRGY